MILRKFVFSGLLLTCFAGIAPAQSVEDHALVSIAVEPGVPLRVAVTQRVPFKENAPVHGKLIEPVYAFDREVIPAGTRIEGSVVGFRNAGKWSRISAMLGGDFTPLREPEVAFHTLVLPDGDRIPLETTVVPGTDIFVESGGKRKFDNGEQSAFTLSETKPGKEMLKHLLWGMSPVHPQYIPAGAPMNAVLVAPLDFGVREYDDDAFEEIGAELPAGSNLSVRLVTALNSNKASTGTEVEALTTRPVFSANHRLILPVGSRLRGQVTAVDRARARRHNGKLAFAFTSIEPPDYWTWTDWSSRPIEGSLAGVRVGQEMKRMRLGSDGTARIVESKKRFIAPAWAFFKAQRSLNATADSFDDALLGAYRSKFIKEVTGSSPSFGLPASISGAMFPPVGIGFGAYGAARSIYSTFLKRGRDIDLPAYTLMEVHLERQSE